MHSRFSVQLVVWALAGLALASASACASAQATKAGWWIRVDTGKTEAIGIELQIGTSRGDRRPWKTWRGNETPEFDLPGDAAQLARLYLHAAAIPDDEDVWFCVYYQGSGVRRFDFDTTEEAMMKQSDHDRGCRPGS